METSAKGIDGENNRLLIFGATGRTGRHLVQQALEAGYQVTACSRKIDRLDIEHPRLRKVSVDIQDRESVQSAMEEPYDAVLSALGIFHKSHETPLADGTRNIIKAMQQSGHRRLLLLSSLGVGDSMGQGNWVVSMVTRFILPYVLKDKEVQETLVRESGLDWTILRPPQLLDKEIARPYQLWSGRRSEKGLRWKISTRDTAHALLRLLNDRDSIGQAFQISY